VDKTMHLNRFGLRLAFALVITAFVLLAHARHQLQILQLLTCAVLLVWGGLEIRRAYRQRHRPNSQ
jgi:hypothetical protein